MRRHELSDEEWGIVEPLLPQKSRGIECVDDRRVINGREALQETAPGATVLADKAHDTDGIRAFVAARHGWANIPAKAKRKKTFACSRWVYRERNLVQRFFNILKRMRGIATRCDRRADNYLAALQIWIRSL